MSTILVDWTAFDNLPESICTCVSGHVFHSHAKTTLGLEATLTPRLISQRSCPTCGTTELSRASSDSESIATWRQMSAPSSISTSALLRADNERLKRELEESRIAQLSDTGEPWVVACENARDERDRMRAVLEALADTYPYGECADCHRRVSREPHADSCRIAAALHPRTEE